MIEPGVAGFSDAYDLQQVFPDLKGSHDTSNPYEQNIVDMIKTYGPQALANHKYLLKSSSLDELVNRYAIAMKNQVDGIDGYYSHPMDGCQMQRPHP
ncbi:MAG: hypothetical protein IJ523_04215 [Succinivibrionaceae bacterium]|nr:hypothetical protein [Succinivibrionaceae bacterium]